MREYEEALLRDFLAAGHVPAIDEDGKPDFMAYSEDEPEGFGGAQRPAVHRVRIRHLRVVLRSLRTCRRAVRRAATCRGRETEMSEQEHADLWELGRTIHEARIALAWGKASVGRREPWPEWHRAYLHSPIAYVDLALASARAVADRFRIDIVPND
jgi:hypothetical protein